MRYFDGQKQVGRVDEYVRDVTLVRTCATSCECKCVPYVCMSVCLSLSVYLRSVQTVSAYKLTPPVDRTFDSLHLIAGRQLQTRVSHEEMIGSRLSGMIHPNRVSQSWCPEGLDGGLAFNKPFQAFPSNTHCFNHFEHMIDHPEGEREESRSSWSRLL